MKFKKSILLICCFAIIIVIGYGQDDIAVRKNRFSIGAQTRVTPIYILENPSSGIIPISNLLSQGDKHYSGPGLIFGWQRALNDKLEFSINPCIRWDYLYDIISFRELQIEPEYWIQTKRTFVLDTYMDFKYLFQNGRTRKSLGLGLAMCGVGTGYIQEQKVFFTDSTSYMLSIKQNYLFPAVYGTVGLKFANKLYCELKMGFCWQNPDYIIKNRFFFPEVRISYDLFEF